MIRRLIYGVILIWFFLGSAWGLASQTDGTGQDRTMDVMLVLDNSGSMMKNDPDFLTRQVVSDFLSSLDRASRAGMVIFDESVRLAQPLTELSDLKARTEFLNALETVRYTGKYSDSPSGVERAIYELKTNGRETAFQAIILLTDGIVETGDRAMDIERRRWLKEDLTRESRYAGIRVFGIAFTDKADFSLIQSMALETGGAYFRAYQAGDIRNIFDKIATVLTAPVRPETDAPKQLQETPPKAKVEQQTEPVVEKKKADVSGSFEKSETVERRKTESKPVPVPEPKKGLPWVVPAVAGIGLLVVVIVLGFLFLRKTRKSLSSGVGKKGFAMRPLLRGGVPGAELVDVANITGMKTLALTDRVTKIGRDAGNDITISEDTVSSLHAVVEYRDDFFYIEDQRSKNRTYLNGEKLEPYSPRKLKSGDEIRLNVHAFKFVLKDAVPAGETIADFGVREVPGGVNGTVFRSEKGAETEDETPLQALLVDVKNVSGTKTVKLSQDLTQIGRGVHNDIVIDRKSISGSHASIQFRDGFYYLEDQRSRNKTRLNGEELEPNSPRKLKSGDEIMFDVCKFIFLLENQTPTGDTGDSW